MGGHHHAMIGMDDFPKNDGGLVGRSRLQMNSGREHAYEERKGERGEDRWRRWRIIGLIVRHGGGIIPLGLNCGNGEKGVVEAGYFVSSSSGCP
jgi:hypothetical protein